jgi:hypothetical protein
METEPASNMSYFKELVNFSHALFSHLFTHDDFGDAGCGLALHGPFQSHPVWRGPVQHFISKYKMTSHV